MWTFTTDPQLFQTPEEAFRYVRANRCIARFVRSLKSRGYLLGDHFFYVVEWHESGWAHWHLLLETEYIPFGIACEIWNSFRPSNAGPVQGERPGFGGIQFSMPKFADAAHAANYACKYLIKHPEQGYPQWVMEFKGRIKRYGVSHSFWKDLDPEPIEEEEDELKMPESTPAEKERAAQSSTEERVRGCGTKAVLVEVFEEEGRGGEVVTRTRYVDDLTYSMDDIRTLLGLNDTDRRYLVAEDEIGKILNWTTGGEDKHRHLRPEPEPNFSGQGPPYDT